MTSVKRKIHVLGINSFNFQDLPLNLQNIFTETVNIAVPTKYFLDIKSWSEENTKQKKSFFSSSSDYKLIDWIKSKKTDVLLISRGDPLWHGIGRMLIKHFKKEELNFYPSNTCVQIAFSKLKVPWQEATIVSVHGRDSELLITALKNKPSSLAIITDPKRNSLETIRRNLLELDLEDFYEFWLCEELGFENEKIRKLTIKNELPINISDLHIAVLLKRKSDSFLKNQVPLFGLKDEFFNTFQDRPNLLTKREIRVQILADLELPEDGLIWDIGAGCGSIGLEALKLRPKCQLVCIDKRIGTKKLIQENAKKLEVYPNTIFEDDINNLLNSNQFESLKKANRVIIGGCDKNTKIRIINKISKDMNPGDIIAIPLIDIKVIEVLREVFIKNNFEVNLNLIQTYKTISISEGIRLEPNNPVFIMRGRKLKKL